MGLPGSIADQRQMVAYRNCLLALAAGCATLGEALSLSAAARPALRSRLHQPVFMQEEMSEEEYLAQLAAEEKSAEAEMSEDARRVQRGMRSASGVEFAPWMKVD